MDDDDEPIKDPIYWSMLHEQSQDHFVSVVRNLLNRQPVVSAYFSDSDILEHYDDCDEDEAVARLLALFGEEMEQLDKR